MNKRIIYIIAFIIILIAALASSYAFFSYNVENTIVGNYEVVFDEKYRFSTSGTVSQNVAVSDIAMFGDGEEKVVMDDNQKITISLENLIDTSSVTCTFDYVWRWDETKDHYTKSTGASYEYMVSGPFASVNVPNFDATNFTLGSDSISLAQGQSQNSKEVNINTKFYNLADIDQNIHANKTYKGGVIIDNINCQNS